METMSTEDEGARQPTLNLRITSFSSQGGRAYMEDHVGLMYIPCPGKFQKASIFYAGVFDGHGGEEAAKYAKDQLIYHIAQQKGFWLNDDEKILQAIKLGYLSLQRSMMQLQQREIWDPTTRGYKSTSGSTASICIIRDGKLFIGHVGDSRIVVGRQESGPALTSPWMSEELTRDHKPGNRDEEARIRGAGGKVVSLHGVQRVVWKRPRMYSPEITEEVPFLAVARSLGDFWSYNPENGQFIVSPEPDVKMFSLNDNNHRCVILASDGVWDMMNSQEAVLYVQDAEKLRADSINGSEENRLPPAAYNPSQLIGQKALERWRTRQADNLSVVTIVLEESLKPSCSHSSNASNSDGTLEHMDSDVITKNLPVSAKVEKEQCNTSSSNEASKMRKKTHRAPSPDITAPLGPLERRQTSMSQRYRQRTASNKQVLIPTNEIRFNSGTVGTHERKRQPQNKGEKAPGARQLRRSLTKSEGKLVKKQEKKPIS